MPSRGGGCWPGSNTGSRARGHQSVCWGRNQGAWRATVHTRFHVSDDSGPGPGGRPWHVDGEAAWRPVLVQRLGSNPSLPWWLCDLGAFLPRPEPASASGQWGVSGSPSTGCEHGELVNEMLGAWHVATPRKTLATSYCCRRWSRQPPDALRRPDLPGEPCCCLDVMF